MCIKKYIPDFITSLNLLCGVLGVIFSFKGLPQIAFPLMLLAAVFDFCDGLAARALDAYSDLGKELDSLADCVSFGVLPAVMLYNMMVECTFGETLWCFFPVLIAVASGVRLAKFNVDERQHSSFLGLPTPACAMICGSLAYYVAVEPASFLCGLASGNVFVPVLSVALSVLLVCELPMFSIKFKKDDPAVLRRKRLFFAVNCVLCAALVIIIGANWSLAVLFAFTVYILMNLVFAVLKI